MKGYVGYDMPGVVSLRQSTKNGKTTWMGKALFVERFFNPNVKNWT